MQPIKIFLLSFYRTILSHVTDLISYDIMKNFEEMTNSAQYCWMFRRKYCTIIAKARTGKYDKYVKEKTNPASDVYELKEREFSRQNRS